MIRIPLMNIPSNTHPLYGEFVKVSQITGQTPGEIARTFLYDYTPGGVVIANMSTSAGVVPASKVGSLWLLSSLFGAVSSMLNNLYNIAAVPGNWTGTMDFDQEVRLGLLAAAGVQVFRRAGPDGKTLSFEALGRQAASPFGGVDSFASILDARPAGRTNIGTLIDKLLDAGDAGTLVFTDGDETRNPSGVVIALNTVLYTAGRTALNVIPDLDPVLPDLDDLLNISAEALSFEFGALPASSTNPKNFQ